MSWMRYLNALHIHHEQSLKEPGTPVSPMTSCAASLSTPKGGPGPFTARYNVNCLVYFEEFGVGGGICTDIDRLGEVRNCIVFAGYPIAPSV
jgi:hypothetical protein